jgi:hypothetical protein
VGESVGASVAAAPALKVQVSVILTVPFPRAKELYKEGGDAFNRYVYAANLGLNIKFEKLDYL